MDVFFVTGISVILLKGVVSTVYLDYSPNWADIYMHLIGILCHAHRVLPAWHRLLYLQYVKMDSYHRIKVVPYCVASSLRPKATYPLWGLSKRVHRGATQSGPGPHWEKRNLLNSLRTATKVLFLQQKSYFLPECSFFFFFWKVSKLFLEAG